MINKHEFNIIFLCYFDTKIAKTPMISKKPLFLSGSQNPLKIQKTFLDDRESCENQVQT